MTLLGYDTVRASHTQHEIPSAEWDCKGQMETPRGRRVFASRRVEGVTILFDQLRTLDRGPEEVVRSAISFESSLPKLLWGHNAADLAERPDIESALDKVNVVVDKFLGKQPDVHGWMLNRVDVTADHVLPDEKLVNAVLSNLSSLPLKRCLPVRGESGSVEWPSKKGGYTRKVYSKYLESGLEAARGRLRVEVGAIGQRAVRRAYPGGGSLPAVTVEHLLDDRAASMRERVTKRMLKIVEIAERSLDVKAWEAFQRLHVDNRTDVAGRLLGYAYMMQRFGGWGWLEGVMSRQGVYKVRKQLEMVGIDPMAIEFVPTSTVPGSLEAVAGDPGDELGQLAADLLDDEWPLPPEDQGEDERIAS